MSDYSHVPGAAVIHITRVTGKHARGSRQYWHVFDWCLWYCVTPPVYPPWSWDEENAEFQRRMRKYKKTTPVARECIACGKVHITSEECGREPSEPNRRDATVRRDDGYKLIQARNMGYFEEVGDE